MSIVEERAIRIASVVAAYLRATVAGSAPDAEAWSQQHLDLMPELASELCKASLFREAYEHTLLARWHADRQRR